MELNNEVVGVSAEQRRLMTRELTANDYDTLLALDDDSEVRRGGDGRGGDEAVINRLPSYRVASGAKELTCSICLDPLAIGTTSLSLSLCLSHTHTHVLNLPRPPRIGTLSLSHTHASTRSYGYSLSLSHTHTYTYTHVLDLGGV